MEKLNETLNRVDVTQTAPKESGHGDHRNEEGLLICGKCGTPKEMRLTCEALDAFKRSSKPKRTGKPDAVEDVTEMPETIDMAEDEKQADW